jgi:GNAT superfamily N-acetyltransferase
MRVERVDPFAFAEQAAQILRESFRPPCTYYTTEYLHWQFQFPGPVRPLGVAAWEGHDAIGFAAATPRRVRFLNCTSSVYILSFAAVRPAWRGRGVAYRLYEVLLDAIRQTRTVIVTFASAEPAGNLSRVRTQFEAGGFRRRPLGSFQAYGFFPGLQLRSSGLQPPPPGDSVDLDQLIQACDDGHTLWSAPDRAQQDHYARDPRPRALLVAGTADLTPAAAGFVVQSEIVTAHGRQFAVILENIYLPRPGARALEGLFSQASRHWPGCARAPVIAPNLQGISLDVLRSAGLRQIPSQFEGFVYSPDPASPLLAVQSTNLEIV